MRNQFRMTGYERGLSLIELMISITLGLLVLAGLVTIFANASNTQHEFRRTAQQIENGRYAIDVLTQDVQLAGFWGEFRKYSKPPSLFDPCSTAATVLKDAVGLPVQAYASADLASKPSAPGGCSTWLPTSNLAAGSDILVIRRARTDIAANGSAKAGEVYVQTNPSALDVQVGVDGQISCTGNAVGATTAIVRRCSNPPTLDPCSSTCTGGGAPAAFVRRYETHIYFVAPCNVPADGSDVCKDSGDDNGRPIPTLKRLELSGGTFKIVPLAEGVEFMKVSYGIDDTPSAINTETEMVGDGSPDRYVHSPSLDDLFNAVTVRVDLLVRNPEPSPDYSDPKTYALGVADGNTKSAGFTIVPTEKRYRRHAYSAEARLINLSGRKEIP